MDGYIEETVCKQECEHSPQKHIGEILDTLKSYLLKYPIRYGTKRDME